MRVLILGYSTIAERRLIPALESMAEVAEVLVASRSAPESSYADYERALAESGADLVYVSLVNSEHARWAGAAIEAGYHVIVDKPAFLDLETTRRLVEASREMGSCLAEATVYTRHPQIELIRAMFQDSGPDPVCIMANFSFPPLATDDFRYRRSLGGGALFDLGPYAVSPGRIFWRERPEEVECRVLSTTGADDIDTSFSVLMRYSRGRTLLGHFGFTTSYCNRMCLLGSDRRVEVDRVFTTPATLENEVRIWSQSGASTRRSPAGDAFVLFIREVIDRIGSGSLEDLRVDLIEDALVLDRMRRSARRSE